MIISSIEIKSNSTMSHVETHRFILEKSSDCLEINVRNKSWNWMQIFLWDENKKLRFQALNTKDESKYIIHKDPFKTDISAVPGEIQAGEYTLEVFDDPARKYPYEFTIVQRDEAEENELYNTLEEMEIWCDGAYERNEVYLNNYDFTKRLKHGHRWYKGDFHTHTTVSDGRLSPKQSMEQAEKMGLDFFVTTDHNVLPCKWVMGKVLAIPGIEITSESSHFNALGLNCWIDFRTSCKDGGLDTEEGMNRLLKEAKAKGSLASINHPELYPWQWLHKETLIENIDTMEIMNDPTYPTNPAATEKALVIWDLLWKNGYRIWGIGGSDSHMLPSESYEGSDKPSVIGDPATYVLAQGLSAAEILEGVSNGQVYVSRGIELDISILCCGQHYYPGSNLTDLFSNNDTVNEVVYKLTFKGIEDSANLEVFENGELIKTEKVHDDTNYSITLNWQGSDYQWNRIQLRDEAGRIILFTNPIFKGKTKPKIMTWGQLIELAGGH